MAKTEKAEKAEADGPNVLDLIKRHIVVSEETSQLVFKATSMHHAEIMLHVDLNGELILTVKDDTRHSENQAWILDRG